MATALVPVFTGTLADRTTQLCDARTLHTFMQVRRDFSNWIKGRIRKFGFVAGDDFITISRSPELASGNRGASIDYHLTLDMAKELAMVENNEQGRAARRYFIECERKVLEQQPAAPSALAYDRISPAQAQDLKEIVAAIVKAGVQGFGETWNRLQRKFRVNSYLELPATQRLEARRYLIAKLPKGYAESVVDESPVPAPTAPVSDAERLKQAFALATEVAAVAQRTVFDAVIDGRAASMQDRWMFCMGHPNRDGVAAPWAKPIEHNAMVVSMADLPSRLLEPGGMLPSNHELAALAAACNQRLAQRMQYEARKTASAQTVI